MSVFSNKCMVWGSCPLNFTVTNQEHEPDLAPKMPIEAKEFTLDPQRCSPALQIVDGCTARKKADSNPVYACIFGNKPLTPGACYYWETRIEQAGNIRLGILHIFL